MILILVAFGLLASAITTNKIILYSLAPEFLVAIRMIIAAFILWLYSLVRTKHALNWGRIRSSFSLLAMTALFTTFFPSNLKAYALAHMASSKMAFFGTLDPFVTALYSYAMHKERLTRQKWLGMLLGFVGMMVLIIKPSPLEEQFKAFWVLSYPELAAFWAIVLSRFGWINAQQLLKKDLFSPISLNIMLMALGGIVSLGATLIRQQTSVVSLSIAPLTLLHDFPLNLVGPGMQLILFLCYTIIVGNVFGYTLYATVLRRYSATFVALTGFSVPLFVHVFGWLFLNESLSFTFFISCLITFSGLLLFFYDERKATI
jgi:drug/metabolite transporter (DMT)-like permease